MKKYVIIGNGIAAVGCIEGVRSVDAEGSITVISKEAHPAYFRPLISYYLEGMANESMACRAESFYADNGVEVIYGKCAEKIDNENKKVILCDKSEVAFDSLCVAAGSSPFVPPFEGLDTVEKRYSFMTKDDAFALEKAIDETENARVLIIGAGLIGLKCAEGILHRAAKITVCDLADRVLSSILDNDASDMVKAAVERSGIRLMLGDSASRFEGNKAIMKSGEEVEFDILVTAVGVRANTSLVGELGGKVNRGIVIDKAMQTSIDGIYAAGDCAEGYDLTIDGDRVLALLPNAYMQGHTAGINMAGGSDTFEKGIPMNSLGLPGCHIITAGDYVTEERGGKVYTVRDDEAGISKKLFVKDGLLKGYIFVNCKDRAGIFTSLIREKTPLDTLDFEALVKNSSFTAFSSENRGKKFRGVV